MFIRVVVFSLALVCLSTVAVANQQKELDAALKKLEVFSKALNYVQTNYIYDVDVNTLVEGAIHGMMHTLDPHTLYLPKRRFSKMKMNTSGQYGGLGLEVVIDEKGITVVTPIEGSPAAKAGIKPGDVIIEIDGKSTQGMKNFTIEDRLQGKGEGVVKLLVQEKATGVTRLIELKPTTIRLKSVETDETDDIAYVKISSFQENTAKEVRNYLQSRYKDKSKLRGLILDLRNNPGGLLEEAVSLTNLFVRKGTIVSIKGRNQEYVESRTATTTDTLPETAMVTLINGGTASAPEIVAGALQDHKRSVIMGQRSFGKGSVQTVIDLEDGSGLKLTVATYETPNGKSIQARGITPDIFVDPDLPDVFHVVGEAALREEDLKNHLKSDKGPTKNRSKSFKNMKNDLQLRHAHDYLLAWINFAKSKKS